MEGTLYSACGFFHWLVSLGTVSFLYLTMIISAYIMPSSLLRTTTVEQLDLGGGPPVHSIAVQRVYFLDPHYYILTSNLWIVILRAI